jgi:hypothetical protein
MQEHRVVLRGPGTDTRAATRVPGSLQLLLQRVLWWAGCVGLATVLSSGCGPSRSGHRGAERGPADTPAIGVGDVGTSPAFARGAAEITLSGAVDASVSMRLTSGSRVDAGAGFHLTWADGNPGTSFLVLRGPAFVGSRWTSRRLVLAYQVLGVVEGTEAHCRVHIERATGSHMVGAFNCPQERASGAEPIEVEGTFTAAP